jgi:hypothetical protein
MVCERCAAHPGYRGLSESPWLRYSCIKFSPEVTTLDVEPACACPLDGDAGILSCTSAVELAGRSLVRALLTDGECTKPDAPP